MSEVYFSNLRAKNRNESKIAKLARLFDAAGFSKLIKEGDLTAVKIHFGEEGNDAFIPPFLTAKIVEKIKECKAKPFITDSNTLYLGKRHNAVDHAELAIKHGYDYAVVGAPIIIADGLNSENTIEVQIDKKHFKKAIISGAIAKADSMVVLSHFKGHRTAGFGGAIKNLGMGCAPHIGKMQQHSARPFVNEKCIGCGACVKVCPASAITIKNKKSTIDSGKCIGCSECISACPVCAIELDWETDLSEFVERLAEYAYASVKNKPSAYINFVMNVTPECDCKGWSDAPIVADIGILASTDPVALDQACFDLVKKAKPMENSCASNCKEGEDKFKGMRKETLGELQLEYGEKIGLGSRKYKIIEV